MAKRRYIKYECNCGWTRDYILSEDPEHFGCPVCSKRNTFYKREIEKKVARGKIKRKK